MPCLSCRLNGAFTLNRRNVQLLCNSSKSRFLNCKAFLLILSLTRRLLQRTCKFSGCASPLVARRRWLVAVAFMPLSERLCRCVRILEAAEQPRVAAVLSHVITVIETAFCQPCLAVAHYRFIRWLCVSCVSRITVARLPNVLPRRTCVLRYCHVYSQPINSWGLTLRAPARLLIVLNVVFSPDCLPFSSFFDC